jgi:maleylacetoacetate isomerase
MKLQLSPVNLAAGEHTCEEFSLINPSLAVPVLVIQEDTKQQLPSPLPYWNIWRRYMQISKKSRSYHLQIGPKTERKFVSLSALSPQISSLPSTAVLPKRYKLFGARSRIRLAGVHDVMTPGFRSYETSLKTCAGSYSFGNQISMAEVFLMPGYDMAMCYKLDLTPFPTIKRVYKELNQLEAFKKTSWAI